MDEKAIQYTVFTKPWPAMPIPELAEFIAGMGFDGVELPVRPGFQVEPQDVAQGLPRAARQMAEAGVRIYSIAGPADEATIAACGEAGIPIIRIMAPVPAGMNYLEAEAQFRRKHEALVPQLERYAVTIGVQNHCGRFVSGAAGLTRLLAGFNPQHVAAVWDPAHEAVGGGLPEHALDMVWSHLCMVNLKNVFWRRTNGPEAEHATWEYYWTSGRHGLASWPVIAEELRKRGYRGILCLSAQFPEESVVRLTAEDLALARSLFG